MLCKLNTRVQQLGQNLGLLHSCDSDCFSFSEVCSALAASTLSQDREALRRALFWPRWCPSSLLWMVTSLCLVCAPQSSLSNEVCLYLQGLANFAATQARMVTTCSFAKVIELVFVWFVRQTKSCIFKCAWTCTSSTRMSRDLSSTVKWTSFWLCCAYLQEYIGALRVALKLNDPTLVANVFSACEELCLVQPDTESEKGKVLHRRCCSRASNAYRKVCVCVWAFFQQSPTLSYMAQDRLVQKQMAFMQLDFGHWTFLF